MRFTINTVECCDSKTSGWLDLCCIYLLLLLTLAPPCLGQERPPNFLIFLTDDQNYGQIYRTVSKKWMPNTQREIFDNGLSFSNAYISNPVCCPSRASILTGMYSRNNGQLSNRPKHNLKVDTMGYYLRQNGYVTGLVGKYLNSHIGRYDSFAEKQFDLWYELLRDGTWNTHQGQTGKISSLRKLDTFVAENAIQALRDIGSSTPFMLYVAFHSPHYNAPLDTDYSEIFKRPKRRELDKSLPNFMKAGTGKPDWVKRQFGIGVGTAVEKRRERQSFNKLQVLDVHIGNIIQSLKDNGQYDNTYMLFLSDNGYMSGQLGLIGKAKPYESSIKVPFAITGPGIPKGESCPRLVSNIDIAPTIYALSGTENHGYVDGIDFLAEERDYLHIEGAYLANGIRGNGRRHFRGIIYKNWRFFRTKGDTAELYNIKSDPWQLRNRINDKRGIRRKLNSLVKAGYAVSRHLRPRI